MPEFIVRARKASTDAQQFLAAVGAGAHVEYLAQMIVSALFISKGHRQDTRLSLVLEDSADYSRSITLDGAVLGDLGGTTEAALLQLIANGLQLGRSLGKEESIVTAAGLMVTAISFEHLVKAKLETHAVFLLDPKGEDIRTAEIRGCCVPVDGSYSHAKKDLQVHAAPGRLQDFAGTGDAAGLPVHQYHPERA